MRYTQVARCSTQTLSKRGEEFSGSASLFFLFDIESSR